MTPYQIDDSHPWVKRMHDAIADTSGIREGLTDDEALSLVEWGAQQAHKVAARLADPATPEPGEGQVDESAFALVRLMTRLNWVVTYRHKKDAAWLTRTFKMINKLSQDLYGADAPTLSDEAIAAWIAGHADRTNGELLSDLIARLTPGDAEPSAADPSSGGEVPVDGEPIGDNDQEPEEPGPAPLSDTIWGPDTTE